jgi:hypothetical protein
MFLGSRSLNNSATPGNFVSGRSSRNKAIGLALAFGVGIGFWTGIVLMVARVWR